MSSEKTQAPGDSPSHPYLSNFPHSLTFEAVINELETNFEDGLATNEAKQRLEKYGENMLEGGESVSLAKIFIRQIANAMMLVRICHCLYHSHKRASRY